MLRKGSPRVLLRMEGIRTELRKGLRRQTSAVNAEEVSDCDNVGLTYKANEIKKGAGDSNKNKTLLQSDSTGTRRAAPQELGSSLQADIRL